MSFKWKPALAGVTIAAALAGTASSADASSYLTQHRARTNARQFARSVYVGMGWRGGYELGSCVRLSLRTIDCDYTLYDDADRLACTDTVRTRLGAHSLLHTTRPSQDVDCEPSDQFQLDL